MDRSNARFAIFQQCYLGSVRSPEITLSNWIMVRQERFGAADQGSDDENVYKHRPDPFSSRAGPSLCWEHN